MFPFIMFFIQSKSKEIDTFIITQVIFTSHMLTKPKEFAIPPTSNLFETGHQTKPNQTNTADIQWLVRHFG